MINKRLFIIFIFIVHVTQATSSQPKKPWLFFTYIAGDNSLADYIQQNVDQMVKTYSDNVHIVAFLSTKDNTQGKFSKKLYVTKNGIAQDGDTLYNIDSGSANTATMAIEWALKTFPADKVVINFWDHGSGILNPRNQPAILRGVCFDDTTGNYLTDIDLLHILDKAKQLFKKSIDIVAFDACLMAGLEVAETLRPYADYLVASEETVGADGFQYAFILSALQQANLSPLDLALCMVKDYDRLYHSQSDDYTLSATNLNNVAPLTTLINQFADFLIPLIKADKNIARIIRNFAFGPSAIRFEQQDYIDLANFLTLLNKQIIQLHITQQQKVQLGQLIQKTLKQLQVVIMAKASSPRFATCGGLSIYLPQKIDISYADLYWSTKSHWLAFLNAIHG